MTGRNRWFWRMAQDFVMARWFPFFGTFWLRLLSSQSDAVVWIGRIIHVYLKKMMRMFVWRWCTLKRRHKKCDGMQLQESWKKMKKEINNVLDVWSHIVLTTFSSNKRLGRSLLLSTLYWPSLSTIYPKICRHDNLTSQDTSYCPPPVRYARCVKTRKVVLYPFAAIVWCNFDGVRSRIFDG